jgi:O-antigen/teichoic acid export membrane protein
LVWAPKFIALEETTNGKKQIQYTAQILLTIIFISSLIISILFGKYISKLVFGSYDEGLLILSCLTYFFSLMIHTCVYNYFRGSGNYKLSSLMQFINLAVLPLIVYFIAQSIMSFYLWLALFTFLFAMIVQVIVIGGVAISINRVKSISNSFVKYGSKRVWGDVVFALFSSVPAFIAANLFSLTEAGTVAFCISLLNIIIAVMSPVNIILLPEAAKIVQQHDYVKLKSITQKMSLVSFLLGISSFVAVWLFGRQLLHIFNVKDIDTAKVYLLIIFSSVIGFSFYSVIRSIIDAYYPTARNGRNVIFSFAFFLLLFAICKYFEQNSIQMLLICFSAGLNLLGVLTYFSVRKIFDIHLKQ